MTLGMFRLIDPIKLQVWIIHVHSEPVTAKTSQRLAPRGLSSVIFLSTPIGVGSERLADRTFDLALLLIVLIEVRDECFGGQQKT